MARGLFCQLCRAEGSAAISDGVAGAFERALRNEMMIGKVMPMKRLRPLILSVAAVCVLASPALAISGADALKRLNHDSDQTLELPEVLAASAKLFQELNKDNDLTLDKAETAGWVTDAEWKAHNKDHDGTLELDEWLNIVRARFRAAARRAP